MEKQLQDAISAIESAKSAIQTLKETMGAAHPHFDSADDAELAMKWSVKQLRKIKTTEPPAAP